MSIAPLPSSPMTLLASTGAAPSATTPVPQTAASALAASGVATALPDPAALLQTALQSAITALRQSAVVKQDGMATLMANVLRAVTSGTLPPAVQAAVQQLVDLHLSTNKTPTADDIKAALSNSGLFTEAALAKGAVPNSLTSGLSKLSQAAQDWATKVAGSKADIPHQGPSVPPPGTAPTGQAPATPSLPQGATAALTAKLLASGSEAALARQDLLQLASLPDAQSPADKRWMVDVPLMTPQGPAVAQLVVTRDGSGTSPEAPQPVWRVGLAVNLEPLGPVRANLALSGGHAWVTIAAERPESLDKLQQNAGSLSGALQEAELEADLAFQSTAPAKAKLGGYGSGS